MKGNEIEKAAMELLLNKTLFKNTYKMKSLKWYQNLKIFILSWIEAIKLLPLIYEHLKKENNGN